MIVYRWVVAAVATMAVVAFSALGCGSAEEPEAVGDTSAQPSIPSLRASGLPLNPRSVWTVLDGRAGAENVGILAAQALLYFQARGLRVGAGSPGGVAAPVKYVADGTVELGVSQLPQVILARAEGAPIIAVGSLLSRPTIAMIWLRKAEIDDVADLEGKTIAIPGVPFQEDFLRVVLAQAGLTLKDVKVKVVGYNLVPALVSGRVDAIFGGSGNLEGARLEERGLDPVVTPASQLGLPPYDELVLVARTSRLATSPWMLRNFSSALAHGTQAAAEHPQVAVEAIEKALERDSGLSREVVEAEVQATLPLLSRTGYVDPQRAARLVEWMHAQGMIQRRPPLSQLLTNRFVQAGPES
jgi:putative hydroxymethylpyrimidine transport system substrate-binding protein